ncbi:Methylcrotonoyl-CoA carboxylase subunit alpha, mitochondrial [Porphyridium purpureum]|uniref:Methylcrotonoyl-CoA carboxylase subunit alpha, mitochondrial n=1 Tax=Porphyridium purpureum TaxID=35688 RepID=A0A5J4YT16_PORPP|nr:Methylcrotonoyl-CoA carboxylase subunit alpha, mitochondrial [Porphyridium purpureum]|eukprot:POR7477..scf227_4
MVVLESVLVANRGEIAVRVIRTARKLGMRTVAVYSPADRYAKHVRLADESYALREEDGRAYLNAARILELVEKSGARCVHPGYGFLSENAAFADACNSMRSSVFVGPPAHAIRAMGSKAEARRIMIGAGVPVVPGYEDLADQSVERLKYEACRNIGFPIMIKAVHGGGGKGMRVVRSEKQFEDAVLSAKSEARNAFGADTLILEKYIPRSRHIEVQIIADQHGKVSHLFDRDCSLQRRHQKVIEEAPAPHLSETQRNEIYDIAENAARAVGYQNAGTVELIYDLDADHGKMYFLEMNTRLQVEHPVTELVTGVDLVELQFAVAAGAKLEDILERPALPLGHAMEARLYAEDPRHDFLPQSGRIERLVLDDRGEDTAGNLSDRVRVDCGLESGDQVTVFFDPMIGKLISHGGTREQARRKLLSALQNSAVLGIQTNLNYICNVLEDAEFIAGGFDTSLAIRRATEFTAYPEVDTLAVCILSVASFLRERYAQHARMPSSVWAHPSLANFRVNEHEAITLQVLPANDSDASDSTSACITTRLFPEDEVNQFFVESSTEGQDPRRNFVQVDHSNISDECVRLALSWTEDTALSERHNVPQARIDFVDAQDLAWVRYTHMNTTRSVFVRVRSREHAGLLKDDSRAGPGENSSKILTPMSGKVVRILCEPGAAVRKGDTLFVVEAMKMSYNVLAPRDATVLIVNHTVGAFVNHGSVIVELEQEPAA